MSDTLPDNTEQQQFEKSMYAMVSFGVGEMLGGLLIGQVVDKRNSKDAVWVNIAITMIMMFLTILYNELQKFTALAFVMTFFWGL